MSSHPWFKLYPSDWKGDLALQSCSLEARGAMIEIMCDLHDGNPYGSLRVNGRPVDTLKGISIRGVNQDKVHTLIGELVDAGCLAWDQDGALYSPRMVRDGLKSEIGRKTGKKGGNPKLLKGKNETTVKGDGYRGGLSEPLNLEVRSQKSESKGDTPLKDDGYGCEEKDQPTDEADDLDDLSEGQALAQFHAEWRRRVDPSWKGMQNFLLKYGPSYQSLINRHEIDPDEVRKVLTFAESKEFWRSKFLTPDSMLRERDGVTWLESCRAEMGDGKDKSKSSEVGKKINQGSRPANYDEVMEDLQAQAGGRW